MKIETEKQVGKYRVELAQVITKKMYYAIKSVDVSNQEKFFDNAFKIFVTSFAKEERIFKADEWQNVLDEMDFAEYDEIMSFVLGQITARTQKKTN